MIKLLRSNTPANYILMFVFMLILWAFKLIYMPTAIEKFETQSLFFNSFPETIFNKYFFSIIGFIVFLIFALVIIKINSDLLIVKSAYQSPGLIFILLSGIFINSQRITPVLLAAILLFLSIMILMYSYQKFKAFDNCFNSGLVFSLGLLIFPKLIFFLPFILFTLFFIKSIQWREFVIFIMGLLTPLIMFFSFFWLYNDINSVIKQIGEIFSQTFSTEKYTIFHSVVLIPPLIWAILTIFAKYLYSPSNKVSARKFQTVLEIFVFYFIILYLSPLMENEAVVLLYAPLCLLISNLIINTGKKVSLFFLYGIIITLCFSQFFQISFYLSVF